MATIQVEAKRVKYGQSLTDFDTQARNAINQLKQLKTNLAALKQAVNTEPEFDAADATAVQTIIDALLVEIGTI